MAVAVRISNIEHRNMNVRLYEKAVMVDPELAYRVWLLWAAGRISDEQAAYAWSVASEAMTQN